MVCYLNPGFHYIIVYADTKLCLIIGIRLNLSKWGFIKSMGFIVFVLLVFFQFKFAILGYFFQNTLKFFISEIQRLTSLCSYFTCGSLLTTKILSSFQTLNIPTILSSSFDQ